MHPDSSKEGGLKHLALLFFPISVVSLSNCLYLFIEKLLLARFSVDALEAAVSTSYVIQIFQAPCVALALMAQVFVARFHGAGEFDEVGPTVWQFIWFSILSMLFTVPGSLVVANYYFQGMGIEGKLLPYFYFLTGINFLFPLSASLSCFYLGRGKTRLILWATLGAQMAKLFLAYAFIFGISGIIPSLGLLGGAMSTFVAQSFFCCLLLGVFLSKEYREKFHTYKWKLNLKRFWNFTQPGFLRACNRILNFASWSAIAHLMVSREGAYLVVMSIGGSYFMFLPFLSDAVSQAHVTIVSHLLGSKKYHLLNKAYRSGCLLCTIAIALVGIPLVFFSNEIYYYLFPTVVLSKEIIFNVSFGVWLSFAFLTYSFLPISYILAFKDMTFSLFMGFVGWINGFGFMYCVINFFQMPADQFWTVLSVMHLTTFMLYYWRMKILKKRLQVPAHA